VIGDDYRIEYCNERLAEISGYSRKELVEMDFVIAWMRRASNGSLIGIIEE